MWNWIKMEQSWKPLKWVCSNCESDFYPKLENDNYINLVEILHFFNTSNEIEIKNEYYKNFTLIIAGSLSDYCQNCNLKVQYNVLFELGAFDETNNQFEIKSSQLVGSLDLDLKQSGFIFRGVDIKEALPNIILKWWIENKDIYIVNPYITIEGMRFLASISYYMENYNYNISVIQPNRNPFKKIIMQTKQNFNKDTPLSLLLEAEKRFNENIYENFPWLSDSGFELIRKSLFITSPKCYDKDSNTVIRNSGKFHAKFYAGIEKNFSELILTSFNLIESEHLQMETFNYTDDYLGQFILSEISKLLDDNFMHIKQCI